MAESIFKGLEGVLGMGDVAKRIQAMIEQAQKSKGKTVSIDEPLDISQEKPLRTPPVNVPKEDPFESFEKGTGWVFPAHGVKREGFEGPGGYGIRFTEPGWEPGDEELDAMKEAAFQLGGVDPNIDLSDASSRIHERMKTRPGGLKPIGEEGFISENAGDSKNRVDAIKMWLKRRNELIGANK